MTKARAMLLLGLVLFAWNVWGYDLWAPDEPYFGEGAREMVADGQWAVPHVNGVITTDKPPLFFWLIALFSLPFGNVYSLTARLPSILAGLGTLFLVIRLGRRLWGERPAVLAALMLATTWMFWDKARTAQIDGLLCFLILVALSAFESWRAGDADGLRAGLLFWFAASLAVLAKGPVGVLLPLGVALCTLAWDRTLGSWKKFAPLRGPLLFVVVLAAWMAGATFGSGGEYSVWGAFREHVLDRAVHGMHHEQPWWYYSKVLPLHLQPWSLLLPGALLLAWRRREPGDRLLLVWIAFVVLFFSISTEKRDLYILPAFPAIALLFSRLVGEVCGWTWDREGGGRARIHGRWLTIPMGITGVFLTLAAAALPLVAQKTGAVTIALATMVALPLAAGGLLAVWRATHGRRFHSVAAVAGGVLLTYFVTATALFPALDPIKSARSFALVIKEVTAGSRAAGDELVCYRLENLPEPFAFYSDGVYCKETNDVAVLASHLDSSPTVFAVVDEDELDELPAAIRSRLRVHERTWLGRKNVAVVSSEHGSP